MNYQGFTIDQLTANTSSNRFKIKIQVYKNKHLISEKQIQRPVLGALTVGSSPNCDIIFDQAVLTRQFALLYYPHAKTTMIRCISLHPEVTFHSGLLRKKEFGSLLTQNTLEFSWESYQVRIQVSDITREFTAPKIAGYSAPQKQLIFQTTRQRSYKSSFLSHYSRATSHKHLPIAIPALFERRQSPKNQIILNTKGDLQAFSNSLKELQQGLLVGRSRRCIIGHDFDNNHGLSRVHALVTAIQNKVYIFDLASRYGLRDSKSPTFSIPHQRLDQHKGCYIYGAGYISYQ